MNYLHLNEIEPYYIPREEILPKLPILENEPEMTIFESAFLCGVLRKFNPHKILEVGIAGGYNGCHSAMYDGYW